MIGGSPADSAAAPVPQAGCLVFRMEPFVMHVEARGVEWSALLLGWARQAGFRESGMVPSLKVCAASRRGHAHCGPLPPAC